MSRFIECPCCLNRFDSTAGECPTCEPAQNLESSTHGEEALELHRLRERNRELRADLEMYRKALDAARSYLTSQQEEDLEPEMKRIFKEVE